MVRPDGIVATGWPRVRNTCTRKMGLGFDDWQDGAGRLILAKRADGLYASDTVVMSIPRQVGKTFLIGAVVFALCIDQPGTTVLWTAHRFKTAREVFASMKGMASRQQIAPYVDQVLQGAGDQSITFGNGSRILFGARERGFGRGFSEVGVLVLDEAQILTENAMDDMVPATNASPNPLIMLIGTPPKPTDPGEVFTAFREEALAGEASETLYIEISADEDADPGDREQWAKANPSFPARTPERAILRMRKNLSPASFRRDGLGIWDRKPQTVVIPGARWQALAQPGLDLDDAPPAAIAIDMSHDRALAIAGCWVLDGQAYVEVLGFDYLQDETTAVRWLAERAGRRIPVVVDSMSPAASMVEALKAQRVRLRVTTANDMARACGQLLADATANWSRPEERKLLHAGQEQVDQALAGARKRPIGKAGGWGWDRSDPDVNIAPLVAVTLARFGVDVGARQRRTRQATFV